MKYRQVLAHFEEKAYNGAMILAERENSVYNTGGKYEEETAYGRMR